MECNLCVCNLCSLSPFRLSAMVSSPWLSDVLSEHRSKLGAAERVWCKTKNPTDLNVYQSLLSSFSTNVSIAKRTYYHNKINNSFKSCMLFKTFSSFFCPPPPPLSSTLTADDLPRSSLIQIKSSAFKQARITPLLKKPTLNPTLLGNYRPVSLLPFIVKTLERVVQPSHCLSHTEQPPGQKPVWLQKWTFHRNCLALSC